MNTIKLLFEYKWVSQQNILQSGECRFLNYFLIAKLLIRVVTASLTKSSDRLSIANSNMMGSSGIVWAPLNVPWKRRLQTLAVLHYVFLFLCFPIHSILLPAYLMFCTSYWWLMLLYAVWFYYDRNTPKRGSRKWFVRWFRNAAIWRYFAEYFPMRLVKTAELDLQYNYIIASHPHGILSMGSFTTLCTEATGFSKTFPGIQSTMLTLVGQFWFPFRREYGLLSGAVESSAKSLEYVLKNPGKGRAIGIVVGGAAEALDTHSDRYDLNLSSRRGFVRYALKYGAHLVPMYNFGENNTFTQLDNPRGSIMRTIQIAFRKYIGLSPPLFHGRGIFNYSFGLMPYRAPITTVVGAPIVVKKVDHPTSEQVAELHHTYCIQLKKLFDEHKTNYGIDADAQLNIY